MNCCSPIILHTRWRVFIEHYECFTPPNARPPNASPNEPAHCVTNAAPLSCRYYCTRGAVTPTPTQGPTGGPCPEGSYCPEGSVQPVLCQPGTYTAASHATRCERCPPGWYCVSGSLLLCPAGWLPTTTTPKTTATPKTTTSPELACLLFCVLIF